MATSTQRHLFALALAATLCGGCVTKTFVPSTLESVREDIMVLERSPVGAPAFQILTHTDGMGWTVQGTQRMQRSLAVTIDERWGGLAYSRGSSGRQTVLTTMSVITCPVSLAADIGLRLVRVMGLLDPPRPTWGVMYTGCLIPLQGLDPATQLPSFEVHRSISDDRRQDSIDEPIQSGRLALLWRHERYDPVGIEYEITSDSSPLRFRLRELTAHLKDTHTPETIAEGRLAIRYTPLDGKPVLIPLQTPPDLIVRSTASDLVSLPAEAWPQPIRVRFGLQPAKSDDNLSQSLGASLTKLFLDHGIPVVIRDHEQDTIVRAQQQHLSPRFQDQTSIGQWTGANILIDIALVVSSPKTRTVSVTAMSIETGRVLGQFSVEGLIESWNSTQETVMSELVALCHLASKSGRSGVLIDQRQ